MSATEREPTLLASLERRVSGMLAACSACGRCVEVCPTAGPGGVDTSDPSGVVRDVLDLLRGGGDSASRGARWAETCTGSGTCIHACEDGVNPRFMLAMTRVRRNAARLGPDARVRGHAAFREMSRSVKVLSRLQVPSAVLSRITRPSRAEDSAPADVVMYLGCNILKTPHIALLCLDVLDRLGTRYRVFGGPASCCGILQLRAGDVEAAGRVGLGTARGFVETGASRILTWCPTCNIQLGETLLPSSALSIGLEHVIPYIADRLDLLRPHFVRPVPRRIALHEHPGVTGVTEGVVKILGAIPGIELVDLSQPRVGYMCNSLAPVPGYKRALHARELAAAEAARVDCLVGVYHACHRELCAHESTHPFAIVNFLELVGEAMGIAREDVFKRWKVMRDVDRLIAELGPQIQTAGLDFETVREVLMAHILGEQPLPLGETMTAAPVESAEPRSFFPE